MLNTVWVRMWSWGCRYDEKVAVKKLLVQRGLKNFQVWKEGSCHGRRRRCSMM